MATILQESDFTIGSLKISVNKYDPFTSYFSKEKEDALIKRILGATSGAALILDFGASSPRVPTASKWTDIWSGFDFVVSDTPFYCMGLREIVKRFAYREIMGESEVVATPSGNKQIEGQSTKSQGLYRKDIIEQNRAIDAINVLQHYVIENPTTYPDYEGFKFYLQSVI